MPNRVLRDWTDSFKFETLSSDSERQFSRLIMKADDFGRFHADPRLVRSACFPLVLTVTEAHVELWLEELRSVKLIVLYAVDSRPYLAIPNWRQRTRSAESKFPPPQGFPADWLPVTADEFYQGNPDPPDVLTVKRPSLDRHPRTGTSTCTETSTETKGGTGTGDVGGQMTVAQAVLPILAPDPPSFEPLRAGLFRRELEAMLRDCDAEIKRLRNTANFYERELCKEARELVAFLSEEKPEAWEKRIREAQERPANYVKTKLTAAAHASVSAWERRKAEIRKRLHGIKEQ